MEDTLHDVLRQRLNAVKQQRGLSLDEVAKAWTAAAGVTVHKQTVAKILSGGSDNRRRLRVDEWLTLGYVLNVNPVDLLLPADEAAEVVIAPELRRPAWVVRSWLAGSGPLDPRQSEEDYRGEQPESVRIQHAAWRDPIVMQAQQMLAFVREAVAMLLDAPRHDSVKPLHMRTALREQWEQLGDAVTYLQRELERRAKPPRPPRGKR